MEDSPGLSPKQIIAAEATAAGASLAEAATAAGVALRTVSRWRGDQAFRAAVRTSAEAVTADARRALAALGVEAVTALGRVLRSDESPSSAVVAAAREVLDRTMGRPSQAVELAGALDVGPPEPREVRITLVEPPAPAETADPIQPGEACEGLHARVCETSITGRARPRLRRTTSRASWTARARSGRT